MNKIKIAIIGGGISGIACAYKLAKEGGDKFDIHIYEKHEHLGGRLYDIFAGRVILKSFSNTIWLLKEFNIMTETEEVTPKELGTLTPDGKVLSGKAMQFYLMKEFLWRKKSFKLFSEMMKLIKYIQSLKFDLANFQSNIAEDIKKINFFDFRARYSKDIQNFVINPTQMYIPNPEDMAKVSADRAIMILWAIYGQKSMFYMSRAPKAYSEAFMKINQALGITVHFNSSAEKIVKKDNGEYQINFNGGQTENAAVVICTPPLIETQTILNKNFGIEYNWMRAMLIKGKFRYPQFKSILSAFPETNINQIYVWGDYQIVYPINPWLKPEPGSKLPDVKLDIDYLYDGGWEFVKEIWSVGMPLITNQEVPSFKQDDNLYICGDFYGYTLLESAVFSGLKVAEEIIKKFDQ